MRYAFVMALHCTMNLEENHGAWPSRRNNAFENYVRPAVTLKPNAMKHTHTFIERCLVWLWEFFGFVLVRFVLFSFSFDFFGLWSGWLWYLLAPLSRLFRTSKTGFWLEPNTHAKFSTLALCLVCKKKSVDWPKVTESELINQSN